MNLKVIMVSRYDRMPYYKPPATAIPLSALCTALLIVTMHETRELAIINDLRQSSDSLPSLDCFGRLETGDGPPQNFNDRYVIRIEISIMRFAVLRQIADINKLYRINRLYSVWLGTGTKRIIAGKTRIPRLLSRSRRDIYP